MSDNLKKTRPFDASRINVNEAHELTYWSRSLGISEKAVKEAIRAVGTSTKAVRRYLAEKQVVKPFVAKEDIRSLDRLACPIGHDI